ncbi:MAG: undecaprenyl-diphosphate phosphatase [Lachnospiraceae bacterium]|nr:undecaprenyl-diphosphate phosphatase [Lachnospiraceae bacterium]
MSVFQAIIMGIVQGLTEFLPVSSSGHLAIMKNLLGVNTETGILFDVLLHFATLIAVFAVMYKDIIKLIVDFFQIVRDVCINIGRFFSNLTAIHKKPYIMIASTSYRKFVIMLIISTIPTGILGVLLSEVVESASTALLIPGICLIATGLILFLADLLKEGRKKPKTANYGDAFAVGVTQGVAVLPGLSRSGTTIAACLLCGFDRKFAVKYSFIMSMPAILGAMILELKDIGGTHLAGSEIAAYIIGMIVAAVVGFFAIRIMLNVVMNRYFKFFAFYCLIIGAVSIIGYLVKL